MLNEQSKIYEKVISSPEYGKTNRK